MRVLAIDTTSDFGSLALRESGILIEETPLHAPQGFSQVLFGQIEALLRRREWKLADIDVFAAASGPGSFTGVRVGLTAAKGLADAMGRGALGVSNLQALAAFGGTERRGVILDARRGQIYAAIYNSELEMISAEVVTTFQAWLSAAQPLEIISTDFSPFRDSFTLPVPVIEQRTLAGAIAAIAECTSGLDPALVDANYVRRSDAELFWSDK
jgi:tRNA threonylcarbamoyladenosine biosynthesis protein TsaB